MGAVSSCARQARRPTFLLLILDFSAYYVTISARDSRNLRCPSSCMRQFAARLRRSSILASALLQGLMAAGALGSSFSFNFNNRFSGTNDPLGTSPWVSALFQDAGAGTVSLTVSNIGLIGSEFVGELYLNVTSSVDPATLHFSLLGGTAGVAATNIETSTDSFKADGDGKYDIRFDFSTASAGRFGAGDYVIYQITGVPTLMAFNFDAMSTSPSGNGPGPLLAAAHIQAIGVNGSSDWINPTDITLASQVPEPAAAWLLVWAGAWWAGARRVRRAG
jgi:hypothetical protein